MPMAQLDRRLSAAKRQWLGQLTIGAENRESRIMGAARSVLYTGTTVSDKDAAERIMSVSADSIKALAVSLSDPSILTFHP